MTEDWPDIETAEIHGPRESLSMLYEHTVITVEGERYTTTWVIRDPYDTADDLVEIAWTSKTRT